ncbi:MAG: hypothetical protein Q4G14_09545 [Paracoccus sp. (in: a-proteobacteria)]|uniref:hypothetical protein n=1 Tax=Paracoccus sp. TaxID=267 RepID=UPI0026E1137E|nr:hypothetical protein [Paracoccus sp. (in: a-proteobacteria)]MDO5613468.1 hypothetical protein [Paracoccus sp. (in: a-proteobacteria)]
MTSYRDRAQGTMTQPDRPCPQLDPDMAQAIGHAVASFGFLEESLKRAIYSLTLKGLGESASDAALQDWIERMENLADDSMGTLIDAFAAASRDSGAEGRKPLIAELRDIRKLRNLICHASWRPTHTEGLWQPTFINTKGAPPPGPMTATEVNRLRDQTLAAARRCLAIMRATGIAGQIAGQHPNGASEPPCG